MWPGWHPGRVRVQSTDGVTVAVHDLGGAGEPVLLAHATGFHGLVWAPLARRLTGAQRPDPKAQERKQSRFHCLAPDLRGHGDSSAPRDGDFHWEGFADDVLAVIDALDVSPRLGVGHSKGGAALLLAEERRPGTFDALYCYEPVVFPPHPVEGGPAGNPLSESARRRRDRFPDRDAAYDNYAAKPPFDVLRPDALQAYVDHGFADDPSGGVVLKAVPEHEARVYEMGGSHTAWDRLPEVTCPVTIGYGGRDTVGPAAVAPLVAERLPHGRAERYDDLGHFGPLEDPDRVADQAAAALTIS